MTMLAARHSAVLSLLFLAVYGGCNWFAARQPDVGVWFFEWERHIPYWPPMAVPYLSIDLFFIAAPFLCRSRSELRVFTARVVLAILVAGVCFVCFPLRFAFERPASAGWSAVLLNAFLSLDRPFNLFPSLHVALGALLAQLYWRHTRGALRLACAGWFVLIVLSTLFTYQHHVVDVAGGLALGGLAFHAIARTPVRHRRAYNLRVACYYGAAAVLSGAIAALTWPVGSVLLWPATSFTIVAGAYARFGPGVFAKTNGRLPLLSRVLLWPVLLGQQLSLRYYRRQCRKHDEVVPGIWIGRRLDGREAREAVRRGVSAVLDLTAEFSEPEAFTEVAYRNIPILDLTAPSPAQLEEAIRFITQYQRTGVVYVHCKIGYSRSAAVIAAWLLATRQTTTIDEALRLIRRARPSLITRHEVLAAVRQFERTLTHPSSRRTPSRSLPAAVIGTLLTQTARMLCGLSVQWEGCTPSGRPRIYYANHTSHADFIAVWAALPADLRAATRPVAGRDYWTRNWLRRYVARQVFGAVLVDRAESAYEMRRDDVVATARQSVKQAARALRTGASLIIFPEGTRGDGEDVRQFKSGLYHLCQLCPEVELVPVRLENMHRVLPKGETVPAPIAASVTFGRPIHLAAGEEKHAFLARARHALLPEERPWMSSPIPISRAS